MESTTARKASASEKGLKTTFIGIMFSAFLAIIKALGGIFGNSYALTADAIESTADIFTSGMLWMGLKWAAKPADEDHPYGHGKVEALVAIGIALALVSAAVLIATESIHNIRFPHKVPAPFTLGILVVVILTKEVLYRYVLKTGLEINSGAVKADAFHHRSDAITSAAAFIGIGIGIGIIGGEGYEVADDWAALLASGIIIINAYLIFRPAVGKLLDEDLDPGLTRKVAEVASQVSGVVRVERCHTRKMGVMNHADVHLWVDRGLSVAQGHHIAHEAKDAIQLQLPQFIDVMIHVEPAV